MVCKLKKKTWKHYEFRNDCIITVIMRLESESDGVIAFYAPEEKKNDDSKTFYKFTAAPNE